MRRRQELEEDGRVDGEVAAHAERPEGRKDADGCEVGRARRHGTPDRREPQRQVEGPLAPKDVASETPEHGAGEKPDVLRQGEEGRASGREFVRDGSEDEGCYDGPEVVACPAEADHDEELPLVPSHADILDLKKHNRGIGWWY